MALRSSFLAVILTVLLGPLNGAQAQAVEPAVPAEVGVEAAPDASASEPADNAVEVSQSSPQSVDADGAGDPDPVEAAPDAAASVELIDMVIQGEVVAVRSRLIDGDKRQYDLGDVAAALRSKVELHDTFLVYHRFQDGTYMSIDVTDGKVRANKIVLGRLPDYKPMDVADPWVELNAVVVLSGTHESKDEAGRTVLTLDKQLLPQFDLELWVAGAPVDTFGREPRTIGPVLLLPLEDVVRALGHSLTHGEGTVTVRRTQDQSEITLDLATGLISVNGTPRGVTPDIEFAIGDELILPFTAVETLTGTHIILPPGSNRIDVRIDDRLSSNAMPGEKITDEVANTPFTVESMLYEVSDRGPLRVDVTAHVGAYNLLGKVETAGGLESLAGTQPAWASVDVQSLSGWAGTVGDYNGSYRELSGVGESRIRGLSWRTQKPSGTIIAIAAGVPLTGSKIESEGVSSPTFGGFAGGVRIISKGGEQDIGASARISEDGRNAMVVAGGQRSFRFERDDQGLQSAYVSAEIGAFTGDVSGADIRARASGTYALSDQVGVFGSASYDGAMFAAAQSAAAQPALQNPQPAQTDPDFLTEGEPDAVSEAAATQFAGVFDQRNGARTAASGSLTWRSSEPWGGISHMSTSLQSSWTHQGGESEQTQANFGASLNAQIGQAGPSVSLSVNTATTSDHQGDETTSTLRARAYQRFDWGTANVAYSRGESEEGASQQLVATVQARPIAKTFGKTVGVTLAPTATLNWNGNEADLRAGATLSATAGHLLGDRLSLSGRLLALSDFSQNVSTGTRFFASLQARYKVTRNLQLTAFYADDFAGGGDLSLALRGVVAFNPPRRHTLPSEGKGILTGRVFLDRNRDGVRQPDEPGVGGVRVSIRGTRLSLNANRDGQFTIQNVKQGLYDLSVNKQSLPLGYLVPEAADPRVTIAEGRRTDIDIPIILSGQVRGTVFVDENASGAVDPGEKRLEGQWIRLIPLEGGDPMTIMSASFGQYGFENVMPGSYRLETLLGGTPVRLEVDVTDANPFIIAPIAVPPHLQTSTGGVDFSGGLLGEP